QRFDGAHRRRQHFLHLVVPADAGIGHDVLRSPARDAARDWSGLDLLERGIDPWSPGAHLVAFYSAGLFRISRERGDFRGACRQPVTTAAFDPRDGWRFSKNASRLSGNVVISLRPVGWVEPCEAHADENRS